jgi:predicted phosphodiesterase
MCSQFEPAARFSECHRHIRAVAKLAYRLDAPFMARQPMLSLHGHIHESRGAVKIGKTPCINPGSEYADGIPLGALIELNPRKGVKSYQLPAG